jgi:hypothetical protein
VADNLGPIRVLESGPVDAKGVAERGSRTKGGRGGARPKAEKKKATLRILMVEAVSDMPEGLPQSKSFS